MTPPKPPRKSLLMKSGITSSLDVPQPACEDPKDPAALKPAVTNETQSEVKVKPVPRPRSKVQPKPLSNTTGSVVEPVHETSGATTAVSWQHDEQPVQRLRPVRPPPRPPTTSRLTSTKPTADVYRWSQNMSSNTETNIKSPDISRERSKTLPRPERPPPPAIYYERPKSMRVMPYKTNSIESQQSTLDSRQQTDSAAVPEEVMNIGETYAEKATDATDRPAVPPRLCQASDCEPSSPQTRPPPPVFNPPPPPTSAETPSESVYSVIEHRPYLDVLPEDENIMTQRRSMPSSGLRYQSDCFSSRHQSKMDTDEITVMLRWLTRVSKSDMTPSLYGLSIEEEIRSFNQRAMNVSKALRLYNLLMMKRSECMRNTITEFSSISHSLDKMKKKTKTMGIAGGTTGAVGGVTAVLGIALAPVTMGASLIATAVGAGMVASAGGMGAHSVKANKKTVNRTTVERLVYDYKGNVVDLEHCLEFILSGMNELRRHDIARLQRAGAQPDSLKMAHLSQTVFRNNVDNEKRTSGGLSSEKLLRDFAKELDQYFTEEEGQVLKKSNKSRFSGRVRLLAENLQDHLEYLNRMWEMFS